MLAAPMGATARPVLAASDTCEKACDATGAGDIDPEAGHPEKTSSLLPSAWMSRLDDGLHLSGITIPGTHDSAAYTSSWPFVATQKMSILDQLDAGIRYFDLRCGLRNDVVEMVHGLAYLGLRLEDVLHTMYDWLDVHPSEGLIAQIKEDRGGNKSSVDFAHAIASVLCRKSSYWRTANTTPTLGELRGRIQLFRRFEGYTLCSYGIDVSRWEDNPKQPFTIYTSHATKVTIQDHYSWPGAKTLPGLIAEKGGDIAGLLKRAAEDIDVHHWYVNFTSAYEFNFYYQITPKEIALGGYWVFKWEAGINIRLRNFLAGIAGRQRRYGIVAMDFPESGADDLIEQLITTNFERKHAWPRDVWRPRVLVVSSLAAMLCCLVLALRASGFAHAILPSWAPQSQLHHLDNR